MAYSYYQSYQPQQPALPATDHPEQPSKRKKLGWKKRVLLAFLVILIIFLSGTGWLAWKIFSDSTKVFGGNAFGNALKTFSPSKLRTDENGHINILIAGNSSDDPGHSGADLTDSIMLLSVNPSTRQAYLLSIPRDLWVNIPGYGYQKINTAYPDGKRGNFQESGYTPGGMGLLEKVVSTNFGVAIQYTLLVDYAALRETVTAVGGVDVNIQSSDARGLYDPNINDQDGGPLKLSNGWHHLDGQTALNLARARGDPAPDGRVSYGFAASDFDRTDHQRQLLQALQTKVLTPHVLLNPATMGKIFDALSSNIRTDLEINQARALATLMRHVEGNNFRSVALNTKDKTYLTGYAAPGGQSALIPVAGLNNYSAIQDYLRSLLSASQ